MKTGIFLVAILISSLLCVGVLPSAVAQKAQPYPLEEVVVVATRSKKDIRDVPAQVTVLDEKAIAAENPLQVDELFKTMVGVDLQGSGLPGSEIKLSMRGLTPGYQSKRVLVRVDGRRVNDPFQGNMEFALLPADNIQRIEVLKGPGSALYGSNAMGGVIDIVTRRGREKPFSEFKASAGTYGTHRLAASHGWKTGPLDYALSGSRIETDGHRKNSDGTPRDWSSLDLTGNLGWQFTSDSEIRFHVGRYAAEGTDENSRRDIEKNYQSVNCRLNWNQQEDAGLRLQLYRNAEKQDYDWKFPGKGVYDLTSQGGNIQQPFWAGEHHRFTVGVDGLREQAEIDEVVYALDEQDVTIGTYVQDEWFVGDTFQVTVGLRMDHNDSYGNSWSPRLGLLWRLSPETDVFASINRAHRAPALSDRFVRTFYNGFFFEGNPQLQPETLTAVEIGMRNRFGRRVHTNVSLFHNRMKDSFDFLLEPDGVFRIRNVSSSRNFGFEAGLNFDFSRHFSGFLNYSYINGTYDRFPQNPAVEGHTLAYLAKNKANAGLKFSHDRWGVHTLSFRYVGPRFGDAQNSSANEMKAYGVGYWRSRIPLTENLQLALNIDNLFDARYQEFPGVEQPGFNLHAGIDIAF